MHSWLRSACMVARTSRAYRFYKLFDHSHAYIWISSHVYKIQMSPKMHFEHMNYTIVIIVMSLARNINLSSKTREYKEPTSG